MSTRPWTPYYGEMPSTIDYPQKTLYQVLVQAATEHPDFVSFDFLGTRRTYRSLLSTANRVARGLWALGVRPGDRICTLIPNTPHVFVLLYAANRIGAVVSPFHADCSSRELCYLLDDLQPQWALVGQDHQNGFFRLTAGRTVRGVIVASPKDFASGRRMKRLHRLERKNPLGPCGVRGISVTDSSAVARDDSYERAPAFSWVSVSRLARNVQNLPAEDELHAPENAAVILYTGGTTGMPRGVVLSDANIDAAARQMQVQGPVLPGQTLLSVVPYAHGLGLAVSIHTSVVTNAESVVVPCFTAASLAKLVVKKRPEYLVGVPAFYAALIGERRFCRARLSGLMGAFCGGDRLPQGVREEFEEIVSQGGGVIRIREGYGLSETVTACATMPESESRAGSLGVPYPDMDVKIVRHGPSADAKHFAPLAPETIGEICVRGPTVMTGYWGREDETQRSIRCHEDGTRWLHTGDLGAMDGDGFLYFVERIGRAVKIGGEPAYPGIVEAVLNDHPLVRESCVVTPQAQDGASLVAFVVPVASNGDEATLRRALTEHCERELSLRNRPELILFRTSLPHTLIGVVDYRTLVGQIRMPALAPA